MWEAPDQAADPRHRRTSSCVKGPGPTNGASPWVLGAGLGRGSTAREAPARPPQVHLLQIRVLAARGASAASCCVAAVCQVGPGRWNGVLAFLSRFFWGKRVEMNV